MAKLPANMFYQYLTTGPFYPAFNNGVIFVGKITLRLLTCKAFRNEVYKRRSPIAGKESMPNSLRARGYPVYKTSPRSCLYYAVKCRVFFMYRYRITTPLWYFFVNGAGQTDDPAIKEKLKFHSIPKSILNLIQLEWVTFLASVFASNFVCGIAVFFWPSSSVFCSYFAAKILRPQMIFSAKGLDANFRRKTYEITGCSNYLLNLLDPV